MSAHIIVHTGQKFNRLTIIETGLRRGGARASRCACDCGGETIVTNSKLVAGDTRSCGCLYSTHGHGSRRAGESLTYRSWEALRRRCLNPNATQYSYYGGRGVTIPAEWDDFVQFLEDVGERPSAAHTLDRVDNAANYSKENCRWATKKEQARNRRSSLMLTFEDKTQCAAAWAEELRMPASIIYDRLNRYKWSVVRTLTTPVRAIKRP